MLPPFEARQKSYFTKLESVLVLETVFAIVDIETCGARFDFKRGRIIDICILVHDGLQVIDKFSTLINPECHIGSFYTKLSGITNEMVQDAPRFYEVARDILQFTEGKIFVAHNAAFDYHFIKDEFASLGYKFKRDTLCTVKLSRKLLPGKASYSLGNLCESVGIQIFDRHRAEGDAVATAKLLDLLLQQKAQSKQYRSANVQQIMTSRLDNIKKYILDKLPDTCGVYYFLGKEGQILYIGKSVNMYSRAISHFNTDLKKTKELLGHLYNADYVETGSELISLLMESEEIKKHKPPYNSARKKDQFTHSIDYHPDRGVHALRIVPYEESEWSLAAFTSYAAAREKLEQWMDEYELCLQYCGLTEQDSQCFHHQIKKCRGICCGDESAEDYNKRVEKLQSVQGYAYKHFVLFDRGRNPEEWAFVYIREGHYFGYGYADLSQSFQHEADIQSALISKKYYPDADVLIRGWLRQHKHPKMLILPDMPQSLYPE